MDKKTQYAESVGEFLLIHGLQAASLRPLAKAAKTSDRMLIYHFGTKAGVLEAAFAYLEDRLAGHLDGDWDTHVHLTDALAAIFDALSEAELQGYMALWQDIVAGAMRGDPVCKDAGGKLIDRFIPWMSDRLDDPELGALTLAVIDGATRMQAVGREDEVRATISAYLQLLDARSRLATRRRSARPRS